MIKDWLEKTIIGLDLCPFARKPFLEGKIFIEEFQSVETVDAQEKFLSALSSFQAQKKFETALFVFPKLKISFEDFHAFSQDCEEILSDLDLQDEFQLVAFHPKFIFDGLEYKDRANLVNSSPYPLLHLLRRINLDLLNLSPKEAEAMSFGNEKKLKVMSEMDLKHLFPWR